MIYGGDKPGERGAFNDLEKVVRRTTKALKPHLSAFDAIAVTGVSGDSVGFPVALRLRVPIVSVRKSSNHHAMNDVAGHQGLAEGARVLFLDDFVSTGDTLRRVRTAIERLRIGAEIVGRYEYHHMEASRNRPAAERGILTWEEED